VKYDGVEALYQAQQTDPLGTRNDRQAASLIVRYYDIADAWDTVSVVSVT